MTDVALVFGNDFANGPRFQLFQVEVVEPEFARQGFPVMEMDGGFLAWTKNNLAIEK